MSGTLFNSSAVLNTDIYASADIYVDEALLWTSSSCDLQCSTEAFETERHPRRGERESEGGRDGDEKIHLKKKGGGGAAAVAVSSGAAQSDGTCCETAALQVDALSLGASLFWARAPPRALQIL